MGKRQIGEMEPFELVITLIIADLATIPMAEQTIPIWYGIVPLVGITIIHFVFSFISQKSPFLRDVISGKPVVVIDQGKIDKKELKNLNMSCEELLEQLRNLDYFDVGDINFAIVERNGKITVIPKADSMPTTREDMKITAEETDLHYCIVENGKPIKRNFKDLNLEKKIGPILDDIQDKMICNKKDLLFASITAGGDAYAQLKDKSIESFKISVPLDQSEEPENEISPKKEKKQQTNKQFYKQERKKDGNSAILAKREAKREAKQ